MIWVYGAWKRSYLNLGGKLGGDHDLVKYTRIKCISIFYNLSYWERLPMHHVLDVMYCEKNMCEILLKTVMGENNGENC
jgi:hypothetical protein